MLVLSTLPGACSLSDHIALIWSGLPYKINIMTRESIKSPEYLAKSPLGQVPLLEDGDFHLTQNSAILPYIVEKAHDANIGPKDNPQSRAKFASWLAYITGDYHPSFWDIFGAARFGFSEDMTQTLQQVSFDRLCANHLSPMNEYCKTHEYIFENRKTVIDAYYWVVTSWAINMTDTFAEDFPELYAYWQRIGDDPGVQRALQEQKG
jgi:glutathione S-transferase